MTYGTEAILPVEISMSTLRTVAYDDNTNAEAMDGELDLLEEKWLASQLCLAAYQLRTA